MAKVGSRDAEAFVAAAFQALGFAEGDARTAARLMVRADLTGADAHGIFRLPHYAERLRAGGMDPAADIQVNRTGPAVALVDGGNGLGSLVMDRAARTAIELARECGVGWVGVHNSNHAGAAGLYVEMGLAEGMASLYSVVASANHMAPWGGAESLLGTNPIAFAIPAGEEAPLIFDVATTVVSYGTVKNRVMQEGSIPEGWMVDAAGDPVVDPGRIAEGLLMPIGAHKGSGLAIALGLLAGPMNGAAFGSEVVDFNKDTRTRTNTGHFIVMVDVARFTDLSGFKANVDRHLRELKTSRPMAGFDRVRLPGEARAERLVERERDGLALPEPLLAKLDTLADGLGIGRLAR